MMFLGRFFDVFIGDSVTERRSRTRTNYPGHSTETPMKMYTLPTLHTVEIHNYPSFMPSK